MLQKCSLGLGSNTAFAARWLKIYIILHLSQLFFQTSHFRRAYAFTAFAAERPITCAFRYSDINVHTGFP